VDRGLLSRVYKDHGVTIYDEGYEVSLKSRRARPYVLAQKRVQKSNPASPAAIWRATSLLLILYSIYLLGSTIFPRALQAFCVPFLAKVSISFNNSIYVPIQEYSLSHPARDLKVSANRICQMF